LNERVWNRLREFLSLIIPVLADVTVGAIEGVRVYMCMAAHQCLAENYHRDSGEEPPADTGHLVSGHRVHHGHLKIYPGRRQE